VVSYHFAAKDDLMAEVVAEVFESVAQVVGPTIG
jgi:AcrR family transcriptional regulator